ncbi:MAG: hypothetical protein COB41_00085 [Proteobacteria bacterium]|nr:MAG: hypothetical protein COB41_00085 [Pseudomonadota bacterium]
MIYIERVIQLLMFVVISFLCYNTVKAQEYDLNWYDSPSSKEESILELCIDKDECHKLVHKNSSIEKDLIIKWIDEIVEADKKIKRGKNVKDINK